MAKYVAFLRGINVGGNKKVPMADLKKLLEKAGYKNIKTLLASGNVLLEAEEKNATKLKKSLEEVMAKKFGFTIPVILRKAEDIAALLKADPFKGIKVTPATRLYVTFVGDAPTSKLKIPYISPGKEFTILKVTNGEIFSVLTVTEGMRSPDAMNVVEKEYGKNVTTRNWNTVLKTASL